MTTNTNFATWNAVVKGGYGNLTQGNLNFIGNTGTDAVGANSSMAMNSGKWYVEFLLTVNTSYPTIGISAGSSAADNRPFNVNTGYIEAFRYQPGSSSSSTLADNTGSFSPDPWGTITLNTTNVSYSVTGDIIGFALDVDNKKLFISKNGTFFNSGDPANGTNPQISWQTNPQDLFFIAFSYVNSRNVHANFGQDSTWAGNKTSGSANATDSNGYGDFYYTPPTNFLALCSANLPVSDDIDPGGDNGADDNPTKQCTAFTFTGNGGTNNVTGVGFQADLAMFKNRGTANSWIVVDSSRGGTGSGTKSLNTNGNGAESTGAYTTWNGFASDGFNLSGGGTGTINQSSANMYAMLWRANGGTTASDGNGSITTTVQANTAAGFSILTYTGTGSNATIGHGLSAKPDFIIFKRRSGGGENWQVYHSGLGATKYLLLNSTNSESTSSTRFQDTEPTNSVISIGSESGVNTSSGTHVAYVWHGVDGYSKFGKYSGNGNANGPFIYTGFRPRLLILKRTSSAGGFRIWDTQRHTFNPNDAILRWNDSGAEDTANQAVDFLSNGFKLRSSNQYVNESGGTFIYMAWGDVPFKYNNTF